VRQQEVVELELGEQTPVGGTQPRTRFLRIVHQEIGDEGQPLDALPTDDAVADRERAVRRDVERSLVGTERIDLAGEDPAR
jgi:hypothetical protein